MESALLFAFEQSTQSFPAWSNPLKEHGVRSHRSQIGVGWQALRRCDRALNPDLINGLCLDCLALARGTGDSSESFNKHDLPFDAGFGAKFKLPQVTLLLELVAPVLNE